MFLLPLVLGLCFVHCQDIPPDTLITLERTECYGECPSYELTVRADGSVVFVGKRFVPKPGKVEGRISLDQVRQLILEFEKVHFFSMQDDYGFPMYKSSENCPQWWTDASWAYVSLTTQGTKKRVEHYQGCVGKEEVERLRRLEARIDEIVNTKQWIKK
jgi:hypothetical protein